MARLYVAGESGVLGSGATGRAGEIPDATVRQRRTRPTRLFPVLRDVGLDGAWTGVFGVARDWAASVHCDRDSGLCWAGGYAGQGVAAANLAARTQREPARAQQAVPSEAPAVPGPHGRPTPLGADEPPPAAGPVAPVTPARPAKPNGPPAPPAHAGPARPQQAHNRPAPATPAQADGRPTPPTQARSGARPAPTAPTGPSTPSQANAQANPATPSGGAAGPPSAAAPVAHAPAVTPPAPAPPKVH